MASGAVVAQKNYIHIFMYCLCLSNMACPGDCQVHLLRSAAVTVAQEARVLFKKATI